MRQLAALTFALALAVLPARPVGAAAPSASGPGDPSCASEGTPALLAASSGDTRELRLGLVLYGGVSLAVYMHGQTKEIHNLVIASRAHEADVAREEVAGRWGGAVLAYYDALEDLERESGVKTRVVVDSIAGTSAGGINGVFLAKALAHDQSQAGLRDLWMSRADLWKLMGGRARGILRLLRLATGLVVPKVRAEPPLDGELLYRWVYEALDDMGSECPGTSLVPPGERLRLFVTTTDFHGRPRGFVIGDPATGREKEHRMVFDLTFRRAPDGAYPPGVAGAPFGRQANPVLAFAARSSSSFPGAFEPINLRAIEEILCRGPGDCPVSEELRRFVRDQIFRDYQLDGSSAEGAWFVDGGVLDNYPFGHVIDDLVSRAPAREVDRRLIYLQPDPADPPRRLTDADSEREIAFLTTVWGALSTIARSEPTGDDFGELQRFNTRVRLASGIIDRVREDQAEGLDELLELRPARSVEAGDAAAARNAVDRRLREEAALPYDAYKELRTLAVVQQLEVNASRACNLRASVQHSLLTSAIRRWAEGEELIGRRVDDWAQERLLEALDVGFLWRQLRFLGETTNRYYAAIDELAGNDEETARALRRRLDEAQAALAGHTERARLLMRGEDLSPQMAALMLGELCSSLPPPEEIERGFDVAVERFLGAHGRVLDELYEASVAHVGRRQREIRRALQEDYLRLTASWPEEWRLGIYRDYLGFGLWDLVLYPYQRLTDAGEFQEVRVVRMSPDDTRELWPGRADDKLGGAKVGHFGAFFRRDRREKDYFWGRLDGAERILSLLYGLRASEEGSADAVAPPREERLRTAFLGIADEEEEALPKARACIQAVRDRVTGPPGLGVEVSDLPPPCRAN